MSTRLPTIYLNTTQLQTVNKQEKYIIFGYIRLQQTEIKLYNIIPKLISLLILSFYYDY